jgi:hypothetical protein
MYMLFVTDLFYRSCAEQLRIGTAKRRVRLARHGRGCLNCVRESTWAAFVEAKGTGLYVSFLTIRLGGYS